MPVVHVPIDDSTLATASAVMSVITFGFCASMGIKPGTSLVIGAVVGIILYSLEIIPIGFLAFVGFSMIVIIFKKMFGNNTQQNNLALQQLSQSINEANDKPKIAAQVTSPELEDSEEFKNFLIVDSMRQLTDLASSQGLIQPQAEAPEYWKMFKDRIRNFHLRGEPATLDEVKAAIEEELEPVFRSSSALVNDGVHEDLALAQCVVNWYKNMKLTASLRAMLLSSEYKAAVLQIMGNKLDAWERVGEREMLSLTVEQNARVSNARCDARDKVVARCMEIAAIMPQCEHRLVLEAASKLLVNVPVVEMPTKNVFQA